MAKSKVPLILRASFTSTNAEQLAGEQLALDLSAYVDALAGKVLKINNVTFGIDDGSGLALPQADYEASAPSGVMQLATGTQSAVKAMSDDRLISQTQYFYQAVDVGGDMDPPVEIWKLLPPEMGFYVAADSLTFMQQTTTNGFDTDTRFLVVIEAERVKLTAADVNFLLVNQTITG